MTDEEMFNWAARTMSGDGVARRSWGQPDPPLHVLADHDRLWCTGGPGAALNTVTRRYCRRCLTLAREMWDDLGGDDEDALR